MNMRIFIPASLICLSLLIGCGVSKQASPVVPPVAAPSLTVHAWGTSQTQGYGLPGCGTLTCHPDTAWPAIFAKAKGWTLDNQAYGSSDCGDLTYSGTSASLWDLKIDDNSRNIYGHFRNDQSQYGAQPYRVDFARKCVEAQTAWLAIPEANKLRATAGVDTGAWTNATQDSAASFTLEAGATKTFTLTGAVLYLATARVANGSRTQYTVSVDDLPVTDEASSTETFTQDLDVAGNAGFPVIQGVIQNFIRIAKLKVGPHKVVYTCTVPSDTGCYVFYAATPTASSAQVYSLSPIYNAPAQQTGYMDAPTTDLYHTAWTSMVAELKGDGLSIIPIDATNPTVYNSTTQSQPDGIHESLDGHKSIAGAAVLLTP